MRTLAVVIGLSCAVVACTGSDDAAPADNAPTDDSVDPDAPTTTSETRTVPTVPPSTIEGQAAGDASGDGVVEVAPTLAPPAPTTDPDADPNETVAPPSTDLVGDPQPSPDTTAAPPPSTIDAPPPACDRLDAVGVVAEIEGFSTTVDTIESIADDTGCRYTSDVVITEIWFVPLSEVRDDWFQREGVEPAPLAGGDAVGLDGFRGVDGSSGAGYTVVIAGGGQGAIVSATEFGGEGLMAEFVAVLAGQAG